MGDSSASYIHMVTKIDKQIILIFLFFMFDSFHALDLRLSACFCEQTCFTFVDSRLIPSYHL